jgi:uncharacterized OsmC-like protein
MKQNNVDLSVLGAVLQQAQEDPAVLKFQKRVEGTWNFRHGSPAYSANVTHGNTTTQLQADIAPGFGGTGLAPDPLQYLLFGLGSCYAATLVTVASMEGVDLAELKVSAEIHVDASKVYGLAENPLIEQVSVVVKVQAEVDDATLQRWQAEAREKCPFAFTIMNAVPLETRVERL